MPTKLKLYPYKMYSSSAKKLAQNLEIKRVYPNGHYYHYSSHIVINWGSSYLPSWYNATKRLLNPPSAVFNTVNKLRTFNILKANGVSIPEFTTDIVKAALWCDLEEKIVVCRKTLTGHSGQGIVIAKEASELVPAQLYTQHVRHKREFRVHVFKGNIIDATEKKKRRDFDSDPLVRSHLKGWTFCREGVIIPQDVKDQAIDAVLALGLDFGAVDIGYREREGKAYVFEVNSAPGLEGTTLQKYLEAFRTLI